MKPEDIKTALSNLDIANNDHWTAQGLPRLDALGKDISRPDVNAVAPHFTRSHPSFDLPPGLEPKEKPEEEAPAPVVSEYKPQHIQEMESNLAYLASQAKLRAERAARTRQVSAAVAANKGPIGRSPIDQKIARSNRAARRGRQ